MNKKMFFALAAIAVLLAVTYLLNANQPQRTPTSADNAPPGSIHNLPVPDAVAAARARAAQDLGVDEGIAIVMSAYEQEWLDSCLGLAEQDEFCAQMITPGYEVTVRAEGREVIYRTNADGTALRRAQ